MAVFTFIKFFEMFPLGWVRYSVSVVILEWVLRCVFRQRSEMLVVCASLWFPSSYLCLTTRNNNKRNRRDSSPLSSQQDIFSFFFFYTQQDIF